MKIWTLMENTACREDLTAEHGLSLYIETGNRKILFDAGQSGSFADNAEKMGIDLGEVDLAILSHGHYDHGGGMKRFLQINATAPIYFSRHAFEPHYNGVEKYIGLDPALKDCNRLIFVDDRMEIDSNLTLVSCNDRQPDHPADPFGLKVLENGQFQPDDFRHEQYLLIKESGKIVCFSGCSHKGILNIANWLQPDVLVGGFHFVKLDVQGEDAKKLTDAAQELLRHPTVYYTGHCTGAVQFAFMKEIMGQRLHGLSTGKVIEIL